MNAQRRHSYFRRYETPAPRMWPVIAFCALAGLDLFLIVYLIRALWRWV